MTITLYTSPGTAGMVVHWMLLEQNVAHTLHLLNFDKREHKTPEYLALNPAGVVPTLVVDSVALHEAAAIAMHLADVHPASALAPALGTLDRAHYTEWMFFFANTLQPAYRAWFYPSESAGPEHVDVVKAQARVHIEAAWQYVCTQLEARGAGAWLVAERMSAADLMMTMLMRWSRNMPKPADRWPTLHAYAARMKALPSFVELYRREGLTEWA